jgi:PP-loop superfamily ATP-utilizing enzyme
MIERGEAHVRSLGFRVFRVRHLADTRARVQIAPNEMPRLAAVTAELKAGLLAAGYSTVEIDPAGYGAPPPRL